MGKYLNTTIFHKSLRIFQASLPIDTGNLRYNATTGFYYNNGFHLTTGGDKAPYFDILQTWDKSPYKGNFESAYFTPVARFLEAELNGKFGGYRFISKMSVNYGTAMKTFLESRTENLEAREELASQFR